MDEKTSSTPSNILRPASSHTTQRGIRQETSQAVHQLKDLSFSKALFFILLHLPLMIIFFRAPIFGRIHSVIILMIGVYFVVRDKQPTRAAWILAYITGAELLWRGSDSALVWEFGKYATIFLCILMLLKYRTTGRALVWPVLFILFLVPGLFNAPTFDRQTISYQLAGPVALAVVSATLGSLKLKRVEFQRLFLSIIAPTMAMAVFVIYLTLTHENNVFLYGTNEAVQSQIGSDQVSSILSIGATAALFYGFISGKDRRFRIFMIMLFLLLLASSVLSFSREGLWNTLGAVAPALFLVARTPRLRSRIFLGLILLGSLGYFVLFPLLNNYTGGGVLNRFSSVDTAGRDVLVKIDWQTFLSHPELGVGVGGSIPYHIPYFGYAKPTHTEYTRLLAEHGLFGVAIILILLGVTLSRLFSSRTPLSKGISIGFTVWGLLYMLVSATRLVAPSFAFGLGAVRLQEDETDA